MARFFHGMTPAKYPEGTKTVYFRNSRGYATGFVSQRGDRTVITDVWNGNETIALSRNVSRVVAAA